MDKEQLARFKAKGDVATTPGPTFVARKIVPGRAVQIDGDFLAYQVAYDDSKPIAEMKSNCKAIIEKMRLMAGAEKAVVHLTPKGSTKGDRYDLALIKEYQANRKDKVKPKLLHVMRNWMGEQGAILHHDIEADDGMSIAQYEAIARGEKHLSVIATKDKDLCMVPGLQLNWDTSELTETDNDFGYIILHTMDNKSATKKIKGRGWKFFWAQMLTGDTADNISGLPKVCDLEFCPTGKYKACGPVMAYDILGHIETNQEAFRVVRDLYKLYGEKIGFQNWRDGSEVSFGHAFQAEAQLLWMRRNKNSGDALQWMKETCL